LREEVFPLRALKGAATTLKEGTTWIL